MQIAAIQMVSKANVELNLQTAEHLIIEAAQRGAELVVLPENFAVFGERSFRRYGEAESTANGPLRSFLGRLARCYGIWLVGGTVPTIEPAARPDSPANSALPATHVYAACYVVNDRGEEVARYDKIHLFDVDVGEKRERYRESDSFQHGTSPVVVDTPWGKLGLAVCYDLRFPEYFRLLMDRGAQIVAVPSAFTYVTGEAHWQVLLRARAIENLCFVLGACQGGEHDNKRRTWGHSAIVDPWGRILAEKEQGEGLVIAHIDLSEVEETRQHMPVHSHRHFQVEPK